MTSKAVRACLPLALLALVGCAAQETPSGPPNLVLVVGDDHGYPDFGFMGSPVVKTPNLDALAAEGVVFSHGYSTTSVCRPALFTLLTGLEPLQVQLRGRSLRRQLRLRSARELVEVIETLPRLLAERGYATFQSGKHWEGHYGLAGFDAGTVEHGPDDGGREQARRLVREGLEPVFEFIERNADRPFFLWFAPMLPHLPHDAPASYHEPYANAPPPERGYFANIGWFDDGVGQLVDRVRELGLERRTLFVYVVDNGWDKRAAESREASLLGGPQGKKSLHELGFRTPVLLRWLGGIEPAPQRDELVSFTDVFVTLLDYADVPAPEDRIGHSLRPLLEGRAEWPRREITGWMDELRGEAPGSLAGGFFWRDARWHYLQPTSSEPALFDLETDPTETTDVKSLHPEVVARARAEIEAWSQRMRPPG